MLYTAETTAAASPVAYRAGPWRSAAASTSSLVTHSDAGGRPASATAPTVNAAPTTGYRRAAPRSAGSCLVPSAVSHAPAPRNSRLLGAACATSCITPPRMPPAPAASTMNPTWAQVEAASNCLRSAWATATSPSASAVTAPAQAVTGAPQPDATSSGWVRSSRYAPAATMVAECSSAETGLGPSIARDSQKLNGNCADLPNAASTTPAVITASHGRAACGRAARARLPTPPAMAAPAATYRPRSAARVVRNAVLAAVTRRGSRHQ